MSHSTPGSSECPQIWEPKGLPHQAGRLLGLVFKAAILIGQCPCSAGSKYKIINIKYFMHLFLGFREPAMSSISANCPLVLNLTMLSVPARAYRDHFSFHKIIEAFTPNYFLLSLFPGNSDHMSLV